MNKLVTALDRVPEMPWKYKVAYLAHKFQSREQTGCPVKHSFDADQYIREMFIPADTLFIGRVHTNGHVVQLVSGSVVDLQEGGPREIDEPFEFRSYPGYQAVFYAVTDVMGRTVHHNPDKLTDIQVLEDRDFEPVQALIARGAMVAEQIGENFIEQEAVCLA